MRSGLNNALYMEINGIQKQYESWPEREFCICYLAENERQLKKDIGLCRAKGCGRQYPVKRADKDFDCMGLITYTTCRPYMTITFL